MRDRTRLLIGVGLSICLHGVLFATVPAWGADDVDQEGEGTAPASIEVVTLSPEEVREILEPEVRPALASLAEAPSTHTPAAVPAWPALELPRAAETDASDLTRTLLPASPEVETITHPPIVDLLRSVSPVPTVDVTPPPAPPPPPTSTSEPPSLAGMVGLVTYREPLSYPSSAERRGLEGVAVIAVEVGEDGTVASTRVLRSSGHRVLDRAAQRNLSRWKFDPAAVRAAARGRTFRQDVQFQIK